MSILGTLEPGRFLADYWQSRPYLFRQVWHPNANWPDADELSGLALEETVASRLVIGDDDALNWRAETGPFSVSDFRTLPTTGWTLLVQGVDRWHPDVHALLSRFDFLPRWRLDDVMVSFAARGGGVGPHVDQYDVFLLQTAGRRRWRVGEAGTGSNSGSDHAGLRLMEGFEVAWDYELYPGDMLYLPPGFPHWGTALSDGCMTCSVGFRAPSGAELAQAMAAELAAVAPEERRFTDPDRAVVADRFELAPRDVEAAIHCSALVVNDPELVTHQWRCAALALGKLVTQPYESPAPPEPDVDLDALLDVPSALEAAPESRFAYCSLPPHGAWLFVDGEAYEIDAAVAVAICHETLTPELLSERGARELVIALLADGSLR